MTKITLTPFNCRQCTRSEPEISITIPDELIVCILKKMSNFRDIGRFMRLNKRCYRILQEPTLWRHYGKKIRAPSVIRSPEEAAIYLNKLRQVRKSLFPEEAHDCLSFTYLYDLSTRIKNTCKDSTITTIRHIPSFATMQIPSHKVRRTVRNWVKEHQEEVVSKIHEIQINTAPIKMLPEIIGSFSSLQEIHLTNNTFSYLPPAIGSCSQLRKMTITNNHLQFLPKEIGLLLNLKELILYGNKLKALPGEIGNCTQLEQLWVSNNELRRLPKKLEMLHHLKCFHAEENKLATISFSTKEMTQLEEFWVQSNDRLVEIPSDLRRLEGRVAPYSDGPALMKNYYTSFEEEAY